MRNTKIPVRLLRTTKEPRLKDMIGSEAGQDRRFTDLKVAPVLQLFDENTPAAATTIGRVLLLRPDTYLYYKEH